MARKTRRALATPGKALGGSGGRSGGGASGQSSAVTVARAVSYADLGGVEDVLSEIRELIEYPLKHPEVRVCVHKCMRVCERLRTHSCVCVCACARAP